MTKLNRSLALLAAVATISLVGCGSDNISGPVVSNSNLDVESTASSGKALFEMCQTAAISTLSLGEVVAITPYLNGTKTQAGMTLAEAITMTPIIVKFRDAFTAEVASLSVGDVVKMTSYMARSGKNRFPYPELDNGGVAA